MRRRSAAATCAAGLMTAIGLLVAARPEPASNLVRLQLALQTTARSCSVALETGTVASTDVLLSSSPGVRLAGNGNTWRLSGNDGDTPADVRWNVIVAGVTGRVPVSWRIRNETPGHTILDVLNANGNGNATLVDRFEVDQAEAAVSSPGPRIRDGGPLPVGEIRPRLVLAHYYPWYDRSTWNSPNMLERPATPYSSDDPADVSRQMAQVKSAGIDGVIVSYQGREFEDGWNDRRLRLVLQEAARKGLKVSALIETTVANPTHDQGGTPADPGTVYSWMTQVVDIARTSPAFLRQGETPVLFVYSAAQLKPAQWSVIRERLRAEGREAFIIGENTKSPLLGAFDGEFDYASNRFPPAEFLDFDLQQGLRIRTYHLLSPGNGPRRIWAATVSPGYDDTRLQDGRTPRVTDRQGGAYYEAQWQAALASGADWVLVTSWNEWWENTAIEPGARFGDRYMQRTRFWSYLFHTGR